MKPISGMERKGAPYFSNLDGFVKSPSAALRFAFVVAAYQQVRLAPQVLRALHMELFTLPSQSDFLRDHQPSRIV
jgi:hypothetical protein